MGKNGGDALTIGVWYQLFGAAATLGEHKWIFTGEGGNIEGNGSTTVDENNTELFLEYFDIDSALFDKEGGHFIQFKVTGQIPTKEFFLSEVKEIFQNATQAILQLQDSGGKPPANFIVVSNRPIGKKFLKIQETLNSLKVKKGEFDYWENFKSTELGKEFYTKENDEEPSSVKTNGKNLTLEDFAKKITSGKSKDWEKNPQECSDACLKALERFKFVSANTQFFIEKLETWFGAWGFLTDEYPGLENGLIGKLLNFSLKGVSIQPIHFMRDVLKSPNAVSINPQEIWQKVVNDLSDRNETCSPTKRFITRKGFDDWMLDRSHLLKGLPDNFNDQVDTETNPYLFDDEPYANDQPQIFAFIGLGGVGKTGLLAKLLSNIGSKLWDWNRKSYIDSKDFKGYPLFVEAGSNLEDELENALKRWGERDSYLNHPVERLKVASKSGNEEPGIWLGVDGLDEQPPEKLSGIASMISSFARAHKNVRIVLTTRPEHFKIMEGKLNKHGLTRPIIIDEFDQNEAILALNKATNNELKLNVMNQPELVIGSRVGLYTRSAQRISPDFENCIRQPFFIGVIRELYKKNKLSLIEKAYEGDHSSMQELATQYTYFFCSRAVSRLNILHLDEKMIFQAIKKLAFKAKNPQTATLNDWDEICRSEVGSLVLGNIFYKQCSSSGLIKSIQPTGAFEWRFSFMPKYLPLMEENPEWN